MLDPHFNPACFKTLFNVPGGTARVSLPPAGTVTVPDFVAWRNCIWLPVTRSKNQPSSSNRLIRSRYFIGVGLILIANQRSRIPRRIHRNLYVLRRPNLLDLPLRQQRLVFIPG